MFRRAESQLFALRPYRLFFTARVTSALSDAMIPVALSVAALSAGFGVGGLGLLLGTQVGMFVVFVMVGGVFADRFGPLRQMIGADLVRCVVQGSLAAYLTFAGHPPFWFFLLGPAGAMGYRLAWVTTETGDPRTRHAARRFACALDWIPAHLMVLAMALVSNFDAVAGAWRAWHGQPGHSMENLDPDFLAAVARSGVDADIEAGDGATTDTHDPLIELADARRLMLRVLIVWLAVVALIVLAGWVA